jgi:hypothetical protein
MAALESMPIDESAVNTPSQPVSHHNRSRGYWDDVYRQTLALLKKNYLLAYRNRTSTFLRTLSSAFFILVIFLVNEGLKARFAVETFYKDLPVPQSFAIKPIPACVPKFGKQDCLTFVYSPAPSNAFVPIRDFQDLQEFTSVTRCQSVNRSCAELFRVHTIVRGIMTNNGAVSLNGSSHPIPAEKVFGFQTPHSMDTFLGDNPEYAQAGYIFASRSENETTFVIQQNSTVTQVRGTFKQPYRECTLPMQLQAYREIVRLFNKTFEIDLFLKEFAHPALDVSTFEAEIAPLFLLGGLLRFLVGPGFAIAAPPRMSITAANTLRSAGSMFPFVIQISEILMERERKLRQAMATMGLHDLAYWLSWHLFLTSVAILFGFFIYVFGCIFQFRFFLKNGPDHHHAHTPLRSMLVGSPYADAARKRRDSIGGGGVWGGTGQTLGWCS